MDDGHTWYIVSREQAKDLFYNKEKEVYRLHDDGSESLCLTHYDFTIADAVYAVEKPIYPFEEGDRYFTIENGDIVESVWDDISEDLYDPNEKYYPSVESAKKDSRWNGTINLI